VAVDLETNRLLLLVPPLDAAERVLLYFVRNREHLSPWEPPRPPDFFTLEHWKRRIPAFHDEAARGVALRWVLVDKREPTGAILGTCNLTQILRGPNQSALLGYGIDRDHVGRGLMKEAVKRVLVHAFDELGLKRVMANHLPTNERSAKLLRALGFVMEGYARDYVFIDGQWRDHVLTSALNPDPAKVRAPAG
jgi:[ribosomal protein S5]-alanine N-acetyltransferase